MTDQEKIAVMQAYIDGARIECQFDKGDWQDIEPPLWNWGLAEYRVLKKPLEVFINVYPNGVGQLAYETYDSAKDLGKSTGVVYKFVQVVDDEVRPRGCCPSE